MSFFKNPFLPTQDKTKTYQNTQFVNSNTISIGGASNGLSGSGGGGGTIGVATTTIPIAGPIAGSNYYTTSTYPQVTVSDLKESINKINEKIDRIFNILAILEPELEKLEKFKSLKAAYNNYTLLEKIVDDTNNNQDLK